MMYALKRSSKKLLAYAPKNINKSKKKIIVQKWPCKLQNDKRTNLVGPTYILISAIRVNKKRWKAWEVSTVITIKQKNQIACN